MVCLFKEAEFVFVLPDIAVNAGALKRAKDLVGAVVFGELGFVVGESITLSGEVGFGGGRSGFGIENSYYVGSSVSLNGLVQETG